MTHNIETAIRTVESSIGRLHIGCEGDYPIILELDTEDGQLLFGMMDESDLMTLLVLCRRGLEGKP